MASFSSSLIPNTGLTGSGAEPHEEEHRESTQTQKCAVWSDSDRAVHSMKKRKVAEPRRCFICGTWTQEPIKPKNESCPHAACSLAHLHELINKWIDIKYELADMENGLVAESEVRRLSESNAERDRGRGQTDDKKSEGVINEELISNTS